MEIEFTPPVSQSIPTVFHAQAAAGNSAVATEASGVLRDAISADNFYERFFIRAAAGAGKSHVLKRLVGDAISHHFVERVAVVAFTNRQIYPLAEALGKQFGKDVVCLLSGKDRVSEIPAETANVVTVGVTPADIPDTAQVVVSTVHKMKSHAPNQLINALGPAVASDFPFDVLFVDEAWQVPHYLFDSINKHALLQVGVGDVGQLPPLEVGENPWRGDSGYNPYRAWPTAFEDGDKYTWAQELPAVWRPAAGHLDLWRAFYPNWGELNCVAADADRWVEFGDGLSATAKAVWKQVSTGVPTIIEVDGLPEAEAPDIDLPLMQVAESLIAELFDAGFALNANDFDEMGSPNGKVLKREVGQTSSDPLVAVLATRNQAVDDAADAVDRIALRHGLTAADLTSSTVDSWQGQTNGITVAIHPLSGASALDEFNSAFGRLAVTCTRATHGLLLLTRPGLDDLLREAPARPGTPIGEPGFRTLPRQTHQRILESFARGRLTWTA